MSKYDVERAKEIIIFALSNGKSKTLEAFKINIETFNRYERAVRKEFNDMDLDVLIKLRDQYSNDELKAISEGARYVPGFSKPPLLKFDGDRIKFGIMSDTHIGSCFTDTETIIQSLKEMNFQGCEFLLHSGDLVEGMMNRAGSVYELSHIGYKAQLNESLRIFSNWDKPLYIINGNHDSSFNTKLGAGLDIAEDFCKQGDFTYLGPEQGDLNINGVVVRLFHGSGIASNATSIGYRMQKIINSMTGGTKPNLLIAGHSHKSLYCFHRHVHAIEAGAMQKQSGFMLSRGLASHTGFWIVEMCSSDGSIHWIQPRFYALYQ